MSTANEPKRVIRVRVPKAAEEQHNQVDASEAPSGTSRPPVRTGMTRDQIKEATEIVSDLITYPRGEVLARKEMKLRFGMSHKQTDRLVQAILRSWHRDTAKNAKYTKVQSIRRIEGHLRAAAKKQSWAAVAMFEQQLARIQGTEEPIVHKVDVNLGPVLSALIGGMDIDYMEKLALEYDQATRPALPAKHEVKDAEFIDETPHKPRAI
jgi:hypothetical protein